MSGEWRPIASAPDDEDVLMAVKPNAQIKWKIGIGRFGAHRILFDFPWIWPPTHWQPLPPPPDPDEARRAEKRSGVG
jgi:hypothetical protein